MTGREREREVLYDVGRHKHEHATQTNKKVFSFSKTSHFGRFPQDENAVQFIYFQQISMLIWSRKKIILSCSFFSSDIYFSCALKYCVVSFYTACNYYELAIALWHAIRTYQFPEQSEVISGKLCFCFLFLFLFFVDVVDKYPLLATFTQI